MNPTVLISFGAFPYSYDAVLHAKLTKGMYITHRYRKDME